MPIADRYILSVNAKQAFMEVQEFEARKEAYRINLYGQTTTI